MNMQSHSSPPLSGGLVINGQTIEAEVILREWQTLYERAIARLPEIIESSEESILRAATLKQAKKNIVERVLLEEEAISRITDIPFDEIQSSYAKMVEHFGGMEAFRNHFNEIFAAGGKDDDVAAEWKIKANTEKSLKVAKLLEHWGQEIPPLDEAAVEKYYRSHPNAFMARSRILVSIIEGDLPPNNGLEALPPNGGSDADKERDYAESEVALEQELTSLVELYEALRGEAEDNAVPQANETIIETVLRDAAQPKVTRRSLYKDLRVRERVIFEEGSLSEEVEKYLMEMEDETLSGLVRTERQIHLFWKWKVLPPGRWELEHIYDQVKAAALRERKSAHIRETIETLCDQAVIKDDFVGSI